MSTRLAAVFTSLLLLAPVAASAASMRAKAAIKTNNKTTEALIRMNKPKVGRRTLRIQGHQIMRRSDHAKIQLKKYVAPASSSSSSSSSASSN